MNAQLAEIQLGNMSVVFVKRSTGEWHGETTHLAEGLIYPFNRTEKAAYLEIKVIVT